MLNWIGVWTGIWTATLWLGPPPSGQPGSVRSGTIIESESLRHVHERRAPEVPVQAPGGGQTTVRQAASRVYVLAFVQVGDDCCHFSPALRRLADELARDGVSVIQITLPGGTCPLDEPVARACPAPTANRHRFFDPAEIAWIAFGLPRPGSVYLIHDDFIDAVATLDDLVGLTRRAKALARQAGPR